MQFNKTMFFRSLIFVDGLLMLFLTACSTPPKMNQAQLDSYHVRVGENALIAATELYKEDYHCSVYGSEPASYDCVKTAGFIPTCIYRVTFTVDDQNKIATITVKDPACIGTP